MANSGSGSGVAKGVTKPQEFTLVDIGNGFYEIRMAVGEKNKKRSLNR